MSIDKGFRCIRFALLLAGMAVLMQPWGTESALADDAGRITELEKRLEENSRLIEKLIERVQELENRNLPERREPAPVSTGSSPPEAVTAVKTPATGGGDLSFLDDVTWLHGFSDVGLMYSGKRQGDGQRRKGFAVGALDFYLTPQLGNNVKSLVELIFEVNDEGETMAELERLQIGYAFGDYLTVWGGRYHTPLGYWNTAFHHGKQIQTTALRPKFLDFEEDNGVIPTHTVGVLGSGAVRLAGGKLNYDLFIGNGPKIEDSGNNGRLNPNTFSDDNHDLTVGLNLGYDFSGALDGLRIGVHGLHGEVDSYDKQDVRLSRTDLNLLGGYGVYAADDWEIIGEFYQLLNRDRSGNSGTHSSALGFIQVGRLFDRFMPYTRFEFASLDMGDKYVSSLKEGYSYRRALAGIRFDLTPKTALKLEGNHTRVLNKYRDDYYEFISQFAIRF